MAPASAPRKPSIQRLTSSPSPARGVANANDRTRPRCVSDVRSCAAAASAAVMPGTTSHATPAASSAAEEHRVAALEAHDHFVFCRSVDEALVDEALRGRMPAAALADRDLLPP